MQASRQEGGCRGNPRLGARKPGDWEKWNDRRREKKSVCEMRNMTAERLITQEGENDRKTKKGNHRDWHVSGSKRREGGTDGCCLEGGGREWTHRGWCGGRGCLWWSVGDRDPPSPWRSAGWGSAVNLCQPPPLHRNTWGEKRDISFLYQSGSLSKNSSQCQLYWSVAELLNSWADSKVPSHPKRDRSIWADIFYPNRRETKGGHTQTRVTV